MVAWKKIMGKFEVGHWMGAQKEEGGLAGKGTKDFGPVPAKGPYYSRLRTRDGKFVFDIDMVYRLASRAKSSQYRDENPV